MSRSEELSAGVAELMPEIIERLEALVRIPSVAFPGFDAEPVHAMGAAVVELFEAAALVDPLHLETGNDPLREPGATHAPGNTRPTPEPLHGRASRRASTPQSAAKPPPARQSTPPGRARAGDQSGQR